MEPDQINILALTVLRHVQKIDDTKETRFPRQLWSNIRETDRLDGINFDFALFNGVSGTDLDMWAGPDSDTARNFSPSNSLAKTPGEYHEEILDQQGTAVWFGRNVAARWQGNCLRFHQTRHIRLRAVRIRRRP